MNKNFIAHQLVNLEQIEGLERPCVIFNAVTGTIRTIGEYEDVIVEYENSKKSYKNMGMSSLFDDEKFIEVQK